MSSGLADSNYSPAQIAEDFPEPRRFGIDGDSTRFLVGAKEILARGKAADRFLIVAESPRPHAHPSDVLHRIAQMSEFPIQNRAHALGSENHVADPVVAMNQRFSRSFWNSAEEPSESQLEGRMRFQSQRAVVFLVALDLGESGGVIGRSEKVELVFGGIDSMNLRENRGELRRHHFARL